ncbi:glycoside hydrolase family 5 protein, partial [Calocera viscosa TUFC12733]
SSLTLGSTPYLIAGPNIYWLGLDENDPPGSITYPSRQRVLEVLATAYAMGANTVRSTTLGVSVGCELCVWPQLGVINGQALEVVDFAVWAARLYGVRLVIPLVDQYEYYHGGIFSFLQFHNLSTDDHSPFYDTTSDVYTSFLAYVTTIMNHTNPYTGLRLSQDPTILAWESGNELGGWGGSGAPAQWTAALAGFVKGDLAAQQLFVDGSYGVVRDALAIPEVDIYSDHFYPPYVSKLNSDARTVAAAGKVFLAGEFDWVSHGSSPRMWALVAAPALLALAVLVLPRRWFPWPIAYGCLCRRKIASPPAGAEEPADESAPSTSTSAALPSPRKRRKPPAALIRAPYTFYFQKWHFSLLIFLLLTPAGALLLHFLLPSTISAFTSSLTTTPGVAGGLYWSLFGHDDTCQSYVYHDDGYWLVYPGQGAFMAYRVGQLVQWERGVSG